MFNYIDQVEVLQIELSTICNALCLGCVRIDNTFNNTKSSIPKNELIDINIILDLLKHERFKDLKTIEFCGTIDEPVAYPKLLKLIKSIPLHIKIEIHTNGGLKTKEYWKDLAIVLKNHNHNVRFSFDGLEDTNEIYRQNVKWNKCIENSKSFIDAGGYASWQFLIFPWNSHQVDEAKLLAKTMRFKNFIARHDRSIATELGLEKINQRKKENKEPIYSFDLIEHNKKYENLEINCFSKNRNMMFLSYDAKLWPCCFTSNIRFNNNTAKVDYYNEKLKIYGDNFNSLIHKTVDEILNSDWYQNDLVYSHKFKERLFRCEEVCSIKSLKIANFKEDQL